MLSGWRKSTVIDRFFTLILMAIVAGVPMGTPSLARADEQQEPTTVARQVTCLQDIEYRNTEMTREGRTPLAELCPTSIESIPAVRALPVLIESNLEPVGHSRRIIKKGVAPELLEFLRQMHGKILETQEYPLIARKLGLQGTATVKFNLMPDGNSQAMRIRKTSGHGILDEAALQAVQRVLPLKPPPEAGGHPLELDIPIGFTLR